jgi:hypothetical protein
MSLPLLYLQNLGNGCAQSKSPSSLSHFPLIYHGLWHQIIQSTHSHTSCCHLCHYYNVDCVLIHDVSHYTNSLLPRIHVNNAYLLKGWFTLWTMKSYHGRLSDVIGREVVPVWLGFTPRKKWQSDHGDWGPQNCFLSLLYPLPWSNGFSVGTSKRGGLGIRARAHVRKMPF